MIEREVRSWLEVKHELERVKTVSKLTGFTQEREKLGKEGRIELSSIWNWTKKELAGIDGSTAWVSAGKIWSRVVVGIVGSLDEQGLVDWFVLICRHRRAVDDWTRHCARGGGCD